MTPLESQLARVGLLDRFRDAARSALSGQAGADLAECLMAVAHPMYPPEGRTPEDVAREIGRREIVSALIRSTTIDPTTHHERDARTYDTIREISDIAKRAADSARNADAAAKRIKATTTSETKRDD
ncbi:MAG: hypothetical protein ACK5XN_22265 [Bacteroidota bacterium]|jgi:hypothetical protein